MASLEVCRLWDDRRLTCKVDGLDCGIEAVGDFVDCPKYTHIVELIELFQGEYSPE